MTIAGAGTSPYSGSYGSTSKTFTLTPHAAGNFVLLSVFSETQADYATAAASTNINSGSPWTVWVAHTNFSVVGTSVAQTVFIGQVTTASAATVTITLAAGSPQLRVAYTEMTTSAGFSTLTLDATGSIDVVSSGTMPPVTPTGAGRTYWAHAFDNGTGTAGSTSGYTYYIDSNGNPVAMNFSCANATQTPNIGDPTDGTAGVGLMFYEAGGAASLPAEARTSLQAVKRSAYY